MAAYTVRMSYPLMSRLQSLTVKSQTMKVKINTWALTLKSVCLQCERPGFDPWVRKIPWRREQLPTPVFWPGELDGQRSVASYSPWARKESDTNEGLTVSVYIHISPYVHTLFVCHLGIVFYLPIILWYICIFFIWKNHVTNYNYENYKTTCNKANCNF